MSKTVLVTGATGNIGGQLVGRLAANSDYDVRVFARDAAKTEPLKQAGADISVGTFEAADTIASAVQGIDTVVLITAPNPDASVQAQAVLDAAKKAGVRKIVRISALNADPDGPTDNTRQHGRTDQAIQDSGIDYVILRPHFFMQNLFMAAPTIGTDGNIYMGMGDGKLGLIDVRDIVDATESAVLSDEFNNQVISLTGPASIDFNQIASSVSRGIGKTVNYVAVPPEAVKASILEMGMGEWFAEIMKDYSKAYAENWGDFKTDEVQKLTGHPARSIDSFVDEVFAPALSQG
jgi:uncharacterized protein YbjT (DUF2867 family)